MRIVPRATCLVVLRARVLVIAVQSIELIVARALVTVLCHASTCVFVVVHCASVFQCFSDISEQCFVLTVLSVLLVVHSA